MINKKGYALIMFALFSMNLLLSSCNGYTKQVHDKLLIEHVYSRPTTAYGPGSVVMYEKESGYTGVCKSEWLIPGDKPTTDEIADISVKKNSKIEFNVNLTAADIAKLKGTGVEAKYHSINKATLELRNGIQQEVIPVYTEVWKKAKEPPCIGNLKSKRDLHPIGKFYFVQVAYAYDLDFSLQNNDGLTFNVDIPKEVLEVVALKIGISITDEEETKLSGKKLFIGFNGDPVDGKLIETGGLAKMRVRVPGGDAKKSKIVAAVDITDFVSGLK